MKVTPGMLAFTYIAGLIGIVAVAVVARYATDEEYRQNFSLTNGGGYLDKIRPQLVKEEFEEIGVTASSNEDDDEDTNEEE